MVNQRLMQTYLEQLGHTAQMAKTGAEAVCVATGNSIDIIFMDVQMPQMDGLEATRNIREYLESDEQPYIIALTGSEEEEDKQKCIDAGMDAFLSKPLSLDRLKAALLDATAR